MGAIKRHILIGAGAAFSLFMVYVGIISLIQGTGHALQQTAKLWYWLLMLVGGFGIQAGLFSFVRQGLHQHRASATASVASSGGVSAGSMIACCAHHLSDVLPLLGLSGLAAILVDYQQLFIIVGVLANIVGIAIMLETIQRHGLCPWLARWRGDMGRVKKGTMLSALLVLAVVVFRLVIVG